MLIHVAELAGAVLIGLAVGYFVTRTLLSRGLQGIARDLRDVIRWLEKNSDQIGSLIEKTNADPKTIRAMSDRVGAVEQEMNEALAQVKRDAKTVRTLAGKIGGMMKGTKKEEADAALLQNETPGRSVGVRGTPRRIIR